MTRTLRENSLKDRRISRLGRAQEGQSTLKRFQQQSRDQTLVYASQEKASVLLIVIPGESVCVTNGNRLLTLGLKQVYCGTPSLSVIRKE